MDIQKLKIPNKLDIQKLWCPKSMEIQKFWTYEMVAEILSFRCNVLISIVRDMKDTHIYSEDDDFVTPKCCNLIDVIPCPTYSAIGFPSAV